MTFLLIIALFTAAVFLFMRQDKFGSLSKDERLLRIKNSINYKDGKFMNESFTPDVAEGVTYYQVIKKYYSTKISR